MIIEFEDKALEDLFITGTTSDNRYKRLSHDVVKRYVKVMNYLRAATRIENLFLINSLHYEKKRGNLEGLDAVWINDQYRLLFKTSPNEEGILVNALITEISKHYE